MKGLVCAILSLFLWANAALADTLDLGQIIVTPNRVIEDASRASSNVTVISRSDISASNARSVADVLERTQGAHIYNKGSVKTTVVDLGGYGDTAMSNVLVLVNGRRTNPSDISGVDWLQIPIDTVDHIEIIRGGGSVLYGDSATGGVVNIITKEGSGKTSAALISEFGSYHTKKGAAEVSGSRDKLSYYVFSQYVDSNGYRANSQILTKDGQARGSYKVNEQVKFGIEGGWHEDDYRLPGGISLANMALFGRRGTTRPDDFADTKDGFVKLSGEFVPFEADARYGKFLVDLSRRERDTFGSLGYGAFGTLTTKRDIRNDGITLKHSWEHELADRQFSLVTGLDYYNDRTQILGGGSGLMASTDDLTITKRELGAYTHAQYEVMDHVYVDGGARHEAAKYVFDQRNVSNFSSQYPKEDVYSGGIKYEYARGSNVFASAQKTFRFLATDEWYNSLPPAFGGGLNTSLKQQTGVDYRAGIKHNVNDVVELSASPFLVNNKNEIFFDPTLGGGFGNNSNYGHTRRAGADLGQRLNVLKILPVEGLSQLDFFTTYTYMKPEFNGGQFDGKLVPMVPRDQWTAGLDVSLVGGLSFDLTGRFVGSQFAINDTANATDKVKPYAVVDTKCSYKMTNALELYAGINNVLNEKYNSYVVKSASSTNKDFYPAPERSYLAGMKYTF